MSSAPLFRRNDDNRPDTWLRALCDPARARIDAKDLAILVAHPGDETIGCGAQLRRMRDAGVIVLTDGTPRDFLDDDRMHAAAAEAYATTRLKELQRALEMAGLGVERLLVCGTSDRQAALQLPALVGQIARHIKRNAIGCLLTLGYEGAHPDRDAAAFVAHACAAVLAAQHYRLNLLEMPIAHRDDDGAVVQTFICDPCTPIESHCELELSPDERRFKESLIGVYATQRATLRRFTSARECFRAAPRYDFTAPPNWGRVLDDQYATGAYGSKWLALARAALRELGLHDSWY